jgi:16S rRNA (cytosine967-C5)-methyltransferase
LSRRDAARKKPDQPLKTKPGLAARRTAQRLLGAIIDAATPMDALTDDQHGHPHYLALEPRDRALVRAILMTTLRRRADIETVLTRFLDRPLPDGASALHHVLHVAFAQILFLDVPDHAAADLAVDCANADPRTRRFASLVNALTRRAVRSKEKCRAAIDNNPAHGPAWFVTMLEQAWGDEAADILAMHQHEAPIDLALRSDNDGTAIMAQSDALRLHERALRLPPGTSGSAITHMPGFDDGAVWVQDAAAGIPALLMGEVAQKSVLDACAAPGGKTAQLLDRGAHVTALDVSRNRLKRLRANLERLKLDERCTPLAQNLFDHRPEAHYDAVLLDAPCSSTGTIRRHPDVAWVKTDADIVKLADLQARMLDHSATLVRPGGTLVFSNCSLDPREGEAVLAAFLEKHDGGFALDPVRTDELAWLPGAITSQGWVRTLPSMLDTGAAARSGLDGFFAVRLIRKR